VTINILALILRPVFFKFVLKYDSNAVVMASQWSVLTG